mmetsp:Transcript_72807/g.159010  ORF Transcript_72807/g.159010 Transcript_72807/m.159010 type:complete len:219 (-) Transcript_72807:106-762(-)
MLVCITSRLIMLLVLLLMRMMVLWLLLLLVMLLWLLLLLHWQWTARRRRWWGWRWWCMMVAVVRLPELLVPLVVLLMMTCLLLLSLLRLLPHVFLGFSLLLPLLCLSLRQQPQVRRDRHGNRRARQAPGLLRFVALRLQPSALVHPSSCRFGSNGTSRLDASGLDPCFVRDHWCSCCSWCCCSCCCRGISSDSGWLVTASWPLDRSSTGSAAHVAAAS